MAQYATVHVQPLCYNGQNVQQVYPCERNGHFEIKETNLCSDEKDVIEIKVQNVAHKSCSSQSTIDLNDPQQLETFEVNKDTTEIRFSCDGLQNADSVCIPVAEIEPQKNEPTASTEDAKDSLSFSRQKMCNLVKSMQQNHIAELFPMMDSSETTEGSEEQVICRICHTGGEETLIAPCKCIGSTQFVHETCLLTWFKKSVKNRCELCQHSVPIRKKTKPLSEWKKPEDKPIPVIWFTVFFIGLCLNILSIHVNASESCNSTACLIFYVVNGFGIVLDAAFLWFWWMKCMLYWKKWCAINQDWFITGNTRGYLPVLSTQKKNRSQEALSPVKETVESGQDKGISV